MSADTPRTRGLDELVMELATLYHPEGVYLWLTRKHRLLGRPALEEFLLGEPQKVWQIVDQLTTGAFA